MSRRRKTICAVAAAAVFLSTATSHAFPGQGSDAHTIRGDRGGQIIDYAIRVKKLERAGTNVRFAGRCSSACTLYLTLPRSRTCIAPGASFGFHLPSGASGQGNKVARDYLVRNYPGWVRTWIARNGGLTHGIKTMDYAYAARHLRACDSPAIPVGNDRNRLGAGISDAP